MNAFRLIIRSLVHYRRTGLVIVFGIAIAAAALTGSLLVGHSVSGSLRDTALARLGTATHALTTTREFRAQLADDATHLPFRASAVLYLTTGAVTNAETDAVIPKVNIIGVDDRFWTFYGQTRHLDGRQAVINTALARDLGVGKDGAYLVNLIRGGLMGSTNLFTQRSLDQTQRSMRVSVTDILPDRGAGGFSLSTGSSTPRNLFIDRQWLLEMLDKPQDVANAALMEASANLQAACTLRDYGLSLTPERGQLVLRSEAMVLPNAVVAAGQQTATAQHAMVRRSSVYLASRIRSNNGRSISYALMVGQDRHGPVPPGDFITNHLNQWTAQDLGVSSFFPVSIEYLVPSLDGQFTTRTISLRAAGIIPVNPTDAALIPPIEGVSDAARIDAWQAPFPVEMERVTPRDEQYWEKYKTTPKAYVDIDTIHTMWASGPQGEDVDWVTSLHITPPKGVSAEKFAKTYEAALLKWLKPADAGIALRPVREEALRAAAGTTDFGQLFIALSFFIILAAAGLAGVLMRLLAEGRAAQIGVMLAQGFTAGQVARAFLLEGLLLSAAGTILGVPLGILYAWGLIHGLTSWWQGAVADTALWLHLGAAPILAGAVSGLLIGLLAIAWGLRGLMRKPVPALLGGWQALGVLPQRNRVTVITTLVLAFVAAGLLILGLLQRIPAALAFFLLGAVLLAAGLGAGAVLLAAALARPAYPLSLRKLALRNAAANRGRTLLAAGLLACAAFLVVTVAANERDFLRANTGDRNSGTGGFQLRAIATSPLPYDLSTAAGRANLGFTDEDEAAFTGATVMPFLMSPGDDISCLNLNRPHAPRVLGVPPAMITRGGFSASPGWSVLSGDCAALADADSLEWTLHSAVGQTYPLPTTHRSIILRFAGTLPSSIFAGEILVSQEQFRRLYPGVAVPRYYLIETPKPAAVAAALRRTLGEAGLEVQDTREVLNGFMRVQNTYLSMFLAIGGLGLLLGTLGLLAVLLRNALERRREFALMLATGFTPDDLSRLLLLESAGMLIGGLLLGAVSALIAIAPRLAAADARIHWGAVIGLLLGLFVVGLLSCRTTARAVVRGAIVPALRGE